MVITKATHSIVATHSIFVLPMHC